MSIIVDSNISSIVQALEANLEESFLNGVSEENILTILEGLREYANLKNIPVGDSTKYTQDVTADLKLPFKSVIAAFLKTVVPVWTAFSFNDPDWSNVGGYQPASYRKDFFGTVCLKGSISGGVNGDTPLVLPEGYRPTAQEIFPVYATIGGNQVLTAVSVNTNGNIVLPASPAGTYGHLCLSGIKFDTV